MPTVESEPVLEPPVARSPLRLDPRELPAYRFYRRLRKTVLGLGEFRSAEAVAEYLAQALAEESREPGAPIVGARAYRCEGDHFRLFAGYGENGAVSPGYGVPVESPGIRAVLRDGWVLVRPGDALFDPEIEAPLGSRAFAAILIGPSRDCVLSLGLREPVPEEEILYALVSLRSLADMALRHRELVEFVEQARDIQTSLLPSTPPATPSHRVAFRSRPALIVGGDLFDLLELQGDALGVAVGDATGHGLPAALQARDAVVGLRIAAQQNLKPVKSMEQLAVVLCSAGTTGRFISHFYAELEGDGHVTYVNAGHPPPLLVQAQEGAVRPLEVGGPVMGLPRMGGYRQSHARMEPGDALVLFTDGVSEARRLGGEEFGTERLVEAVRRDGDPERSVARIFDELDRFTEGAPQADDQTVVVVVRQSSRTR